MFQLLVPCLSAFATLVILASAGGPKSNSAALDNAQLLKAKLEEAQLIKALNATEGTQLGAMIEKLKQLNSTEIQALVETTFGNSTEREGKMYGGFGGGLGFGGFGGGWGGGFGGGISPILLALLLKDKKDDFPAHWAMQRPQQNTGGSTDLATLATLALLGLALISKLPTQG